MRNYRRVAYGDRCQIHAFLQAEVSVLKIANQLGFHKTSIYREISRNRILKRGYIAGRAHQLWVRRIRNCRRPRVITGTLRVYVVNRLMEGWSPEQISGRLKHEKNGNVSAPTIYRFVRQHWAAFKTCLRWYNRRGGGRLRMRRYKRGIGLSIYSRPEAANRRSRRGDWERDCFMVAKRKLVLVCTDRLSRYTLIQKVPQFTAKAMSRLTWRMIRSTRKRAFTITNDNGTEFREGPSMKIPVYYCSPNKPQQRGTIENTIGLIRHYIKQDVNHDTLTEEYVTEVQEALNYRPRKCLDYRTPYEVFFKKKVALAM
jgi:transposase, IS30 family